MTDLRKIRTALAAASASPDLEVRAIYMAVAKTLVASLAADLRQASLTLDAMELELVRARGAT